MGGSRRDAEIGKEAILAMDKGDRLSAVGIALAGVHRWRESVFECLLPRPLMPVVESPLIGYALRWLRDGGIRHTTVCANSDSRLVRRSLGDGSDFDLDIRYYEDMTPRGPAGCVRDAALDRPAANYIVIECTIIPAIDLARLLAAHSESGAAVTICVTHPNGSGGRDGGMPSSVGVYVLAARALEAIPPIGYQDIKESLIPQLHKQGEHIATYVADAYCPRVTGPASYLDATAWVLERISHDATLLPQYDKVGRARVAGTARVSETARLIGPVLIGPGCEIGADVIVIGPTVIGKDCRVADGAVVSRSVVWDRCRIGPNSFINQCILPWDVEVAGDAQIHCELYTGASASGGSRYPSPSQQTTGSSSWANATPRSSELAVESCMPASSLGVHASSAGDGHARG